MKKLIIVLLFIVSMFVMGKDEIVLSIPPWGGTKEEVYQYFETFIQYLSEKTGKKVRFEVSIDYESLGKEMNNDKIDIGIFPSSAYVKAKKDFPNLQYFCTPLNFKTLKDSYSSYIFVRKDSGIKNYQDLKGKIFAFVDESSSSGYRFPFAMMILKWKVESKSFFKKTVFLGNHPDVLKAVYENKVDGGVVSEITFREFSEKVAKDTFAIIDQVDDIPYDGVVVSPNLDKETQEKIKSIFLQINKSTKTKDGRIVLNEKMTWGGFAVRDDKFYDIVRDTAKVIKEYETKK